MRRLPRHLIDKISTRATMLELLGASSAEARKQAIAEVAKENPQSKPAPRLPAPTHRPSRSGLHYSDAMDVVRDLLRPFVGHQPPPPSSTSSSSSNRRSRPAGHQSVQGVRQDAPRPVDPTLPATKHSLPLLYTDGQRSGRGTNINHEFSDSPATQTWRQQNQRE